MSLTPSYLASWPGRFRHPRLWVEAVATVSEDELTGSHVDDPEGPAGDPPNDRVATALLEDVAAGLNEPRALAYLLARGELAVAASFIENSPWLRRDPAAAQEAGRRLRRRQREAAEEVLDAVELARSRAEAAGVPVPDLPEVGGEDEPFRLLLMRNRIAAANKELDYQVGAARLKTEERTDEDRPALSEILLAAWRQRISRGQLVTAERLLAAGGEDILPPDAVPPLRAWDPTVDATAALERVRRRPRDSEWSAGPAGQLLIESYGGLRHDGSAEAAEAFCSALVEFVGGTPARRPRPYPGGYLFRLDLLGQLARSPGVAVRRPGRRPDRRQRDPAGHRGREPADRCRRRVRRRPAPRSLEPGRPLGERPHQAEHGPRHRGLQLLRLAGRFWTVRASGVGDAETLGAFLGGPEPVAWIRLAWLVDILGLGGAELTRELTNETGIDPTGLSVLLDLVLRSHRDASQGRVTRLWQTVDARSRLVDAVLPSATPDPAARIVFLAALAADGFDAPLQLADLELSIAVEGGDAPASLLERGLVDLVGHPLAEVVDQGVRLLRCAVLTRMREDAPAMLLELLAALAAKGPSNQALTRHRWALLPDGETGGVLEDLLRRRNEAIERAAASDVPHDAVAVIDLLAGDLGEAYRSRAGS